MSIINPDTGCPYNWHDVDVSTPVNADWPRVSSNSDIGGIGGLVAFVASAYLTLVLVFLYYISGCRSNGTPPGINRIDGRLIRTFSRWPGIRWIAREREAWEPFLRQAVLMYSDQQLIAGIAILVSGYSQIFDLSSYHWQLMIYLAWFASLSHLTTLTALREYFRQNASSKSLRLVLMMLSMLLLIVALIPTADTSWITSPQMDFTGAIKAICFYKRVGTGTIDSSGNQGVFFVVSVIILVFSCTARTVRLYGASSSWCEEYLRKRPSAFLRSHLEYVLARLNQSKQSFRWQSYYLVVCTVYLLPKAVYEIYGSMFWEIWWLFIGLLFGLLRLSLSRDSGEIIGFGQARKPLEDDKWTFGQGIAIIFLLLPLLTLSGHYSDIRSGLQTDVKGHQTHEIPPDGQLQVHDTPRQQILVLGRSSNIPNLRKPRKQSSSRQPGQHAEAMELQSVATSATLPSPSSNVRQRPIAEAPSKLGSVDIEERGLSFPNTHPPQSHLTALYQDPYRYEWFRLTIRMLILFSFYTLLNIVISVNLGGEVGVGIFASQAVVIGVIILAAFTWTFACLWFEVYCAGDEGFAAKTLTRRQVYWRHKVWKIFYWFLLAVAMAFATIGFWFFQGGFTRV